MAKWSTNRYLFQWVKLTINQHWLTNDDPIPWCIGLHASLLLIYCSILVIKAPEVIKHGISHVIVGGILWCRHFGFHLQSTWDPWSFPWDQSQNRDPFHERFSHRNSNSLEISFCSRPSYSEVIAIKFCTWHDSCAVVPCAKFCSGMIPYNINTNFPSDLNYDGKSFVKRDPVQLPWQCYFRHANMYKSTLILYDLIVLLFLGSWSTVLMDLVAGVGGQVCFRHERGSVCLCFSSKFISSRFVVAITIWQIVKHCCIAHWF